MCIFKENLQTGKQKYLVKKISLTDKNNEPFHKNLKCLKNICCHVEML